MIHWYDHAVATCVIQQCALFEFGGGHSHWNTAIRGLSREPSGLCSNLTDHSQLPAETMDICLKAKPDGFSTAVAVSTDMRLSSEVELPPEFEGNDKLCKEYRQG